MKEPLAYRRPRGRLSSPEVRIRLGKSSKGWPTGQGGKRSRSSSGRAMRSIIMPWSWRSSWRSCYA